MLSWIVFFSLRLAGSDTEVLKLRGTRTADKTVADAHYCLDAIPAFTEFLPQSPDVNVERARVAVITVSPYAVQKLLAGYDAVRAPGQH